LAIGSTRAQRRKELKAAFRRLLTSAGLGVMIVASLYFYNFLTTNEKLAIADVEFQGLSRVDTAEIARLVADLEGQNILLVPLEQYSARFSGHPRVRRADFKRVLPDRIVCVVEEREPVALVFAGKFHEVDEEGMIMPSDDLTELLDLPIITGLNGETVRAGKPCRDPRLMEALAALGMCKKYGGRFAENISELRLGEAGISVVSLKEDMVLLLGEYQVENRLKKFFVLKNKISEEDLGARFVDLRFDDQIVLRGGI
jgi:cell division protein FtsQ